MTERHVRAARLIVDYYAALNDRFDIRREDPVIGPMVVGSQELYAKYKRNMGFGAANEAAMVDVIAAFLAEDTP